MNASPSLSANDSLDALQAWIADWLVEHGGVARAAIAFDVRLRDLGLDSARATRLVAALAVRLGRPIPLTLLWDYPTIAELARYLTQPAAAPPAIEAIGEALSDSIDRSIAVIGMACRFPGGADTPEKFWELLAAGRDVVGPVPADRFDADAYYDRDPHARGKAVTRWGGFLERTDAFDPYFFGISPREAAEMDPQQRVMLELAWEVFEAAGLPKDALRDRAVGVFAGAMWNDYARLPRGGARAIEQFTATGHDDSIIAARISYHFGLRGPSLTVNTACSSSLVAVHLACQSLLAGESQLALAGAVNLIFGPDSTIAMSKFGGMARDGRCKAFDARADGYVRGEGAAAVLLKPLRRAQQDGDRIHAIIRGSAINNDGFSNGLTSPSPAAQAAMLRAAYAHAGVSPADVHYVEAHGTGTMLGDPIEAGALGEVLGQHSDRRCPLRIGSAKTNIGHLEAAAGMAGLIKTIEAMKHRQLPASLHFEQANPNIQFDALQLAVQSASTPWPTDEDVLVAGVSSFGFGGTNAHVVLESFAPPRPIAIPIAASDPDALRARLAALHAFVNEHPDASLDDIQRAQIEALESAPVRRAIAARSRADLLEQLAASPSAAQRIADARPVFVFTGNGSQWSGMAHDLMQEDAVFRRAIAQCDEALRGAGCDGIGRALALGQFDVQRVDLVQPLLWAVQVGLVALWRAHGVEPAAVVGHSVGEIAAALAAGALDLDAAARVVVHRSRLQAECANQGGMVLLETDPETARALVGAAGDDGLAIAALNARVHTVVSGPLAGLAALVERAGQAGVSARTVRVNVAYHGPQMDPLRERLRGALGDLAPCRAQLPMISTVTGRPVEEALLDADYWVRNLRDPVRFGDAIETLVHGGHRLFLEIGPHPTLAPAIAAQLGADGFTGASLERERASRPRMLDTLCRLFERGAAVAWRKPPARAVLLPISAHGDAALEQRVEALRERTGADRPLDLEALGHTLGRGRTHLTHRCAIVAASPDELATSELIRAPVALAGRPKIAFVFPGQGSQWIGMGRQLLESEPVFRRAIEPWDTLLAEFTGWSLLAQLRADGAASRLDEVDVIQPAIFAVQVALAALWRSWGVHPDAVIGHSMGEVAAAFVAGALSSRDAARIIGLRSQLAKRTSGRGGMAMVELSPDDCRRALAAHAATVSLAACNGPTSCLLSGDSAALDAIGAELRAAGVFFRAVKVDYASHSPQMDAIKDELAHALRETAPRAAAIAFHSTVDGALVDGARLDAAYWARNLREPVLFCQGIQSLEARGFNAFVEISPHPVLAYSIGKSVRADSALILSSLVRDRDERRALLASLGALFAAGGSVDWSALAPGVGAPVALPAYPFQRERCWFAEPETGHARSERASRHAFLDACVRSPFPSERLIWEIELGLERFPYLADHRVSGLAVFPGTGYIECVLEAARELYGDAAVELSQIAFEKALFLDDGGGSKTLQLALEPAGAGHRFSLASYDAALAAWTQHVTGQLHPSDPGAACAVPSDRGEPRAPVDVAAFYANLERAGNTYGPRFQAVERLETSAAVVRGRVALGEALTTRGARIHPVLFDACLQVMATPIAMNLAAGARASAFMPMRAERIRWFRDAGRAAVSHVRFLDGAAPDPATGDLYADIDVTDEQGQLVVRVERICFHLLEHATQAARPARSAGELLYRVAWEDAPPPTAVDASLEDAHQRRWFVFADDSGVADAAAELCSEALAVHRIYPGSGFRRDGNDFTIRPGEPADYRALFQALAVSRSAAPLGILHLWNLRLPGGDAMSSAQLRAAAELGCLSVALLLHALDELVLAAPPRLWIATRGAWAIAGDEHALSPAQAAVWGLTRAIAQEYPALWGRIVDLDPSEPHQLAAARLAVELAAAPVEDRVAYRGGRRRAARLVRDPDAGIAAAAELRSDRSYLITGGLGALGTRLAAWMIGRGARHLILLGRTPLPPRRRWHRGEHDPATRAKIDAVLALERLGAHVATPALDLGDGAALAAFLDDHAQEARPPIAGVAHLAGVMRPELLGALRGDALAASFQSKVHGAWNLHRAFTGAALDFFALFSSAAAVLNSPRLGGYAAANAFLDGLAHFRRARGEPALVVNWGFWSEAGMAARDLQYDASAADAQGMRSFSPATGLEIFGGLLARDPVQSVVMDIDWPSWIAMYPDAAASPLLRAIRAEVGEGAGAPAPATAAAQPLRELSLVERRAAVDQILFDELSSVLRMSAAKIARAALFGSMGLDSMLSLELRNRLERRTGLTLPGTLAWNYPSLERMSAFLVEQLGEPAGGPPPSAALIDLLRELGVIDGDHDPVLQNPEALQSLLREAEAFLE